ncbi:hypothetical protein Tco_0964915, partial [Tanacetum coccineum]
VQRIENKAKTDHCLAQLVLWLALRFHPGGPEFETQEGLSPPRHVSCHVVPRGCHVAYQEGSGSTRVVRRLVDRDILQLATVVHALG